MVASGCQAVPKADPSGDEFSWRLSFSRGELLLSKHVTDRARMAYVAAKLFWKEKLKSLCPALRSYHLKTLFYHFLENTPAVEVEESTTQELLQRLLLFLQKHLETRTCPHFFISSINLFDFTTAPFFEQTNQRIDMCVKILQDSQADTNMIPAIFSRKSKNMMIFRYFKAQHPYLWNALLFSLIILNLIFFCAGAAVYICGFFSLISIVISFLYGVCITVPVVFISFMAVKIFQCVKS